MIKMKSFQERMDEMLAYMSAEVNTYLPLNGIIEAFAEQQAKVYNSMNAILASQIPQNNIWFYPDGTPTFDKPRIGDGWADSYGQWEWDGLIWVKIPKDALPKCYEFRAPADPKSCECGSEKVGSSSHSGYCPKYDKS